MELEEMTELLSNPATYIVVLAVGAALVKGLFWLRDVHHVKNGWHTFTKEIREDIKKILLIIRTPVASGSPLQLTDFGEQISSKLEARNWAEILAPTLREEVEGKQPFEIDEFSNSYVEKKLDKDMRARVAGCAYEFGIEHAGVHSVLRVVLRDQLLRITSGPGQPTSS